MSVDASTAASAARTVGDGRAVLGVVTKVLAEGYTAVDNAPILATTLFDIAQVERDRLDGVNQEAKRHYDELSAFPNDTLLTDLQRQKIALDARQAEAVLLDIQTEWASGFWDVGQQITDVLSQSAKTFAWGLGGLTVAALLVVGLVVFVKVR